MIVCLTGSHSTGKSTLLKAFSNIPDIVQVDSVTRSSISAEERRVDGGVTDEGQLAILEAIKKKCIELEDANRRDPNKIYLLDRSVFDFVAYSRVFYERGQISVYTWVRIAKFFEEHMNMYDLVCYLPIEFDLVDDGVRSLDEDLRRKVDERILTDVLWSQNRVIKLTGTVESRVQQVLEAIENIKS